MFLKLLHRLHVPSDLAYGMALASILGSIAIWAQRNEKNPANAERLGIFIGLWAPTFMIIGNGLHVEEAQSPRTQDEADALAAKVQDTAQSFGPA
jgi:RNase H-fold protein (predicted Holliday junction resolvase)